MIRRSSARAVRASSGNVGVVGIARCAVCCQGDAALGRGVFMPPYSVRAGCFVCFIEGVQRSHAGHTAMAPVTGALETRKPEMQSTGTGTAAASRPWEGRACSLQTPRSGGCSAATNHHPPNGTLSLDADRRRPRVMLAVF